jgi:hypothetical protein
MKAVTGTNGHETTKGVLFSLMELAAKGIIFVLPLISNQKLTQGRKLRCFSPNSLKCKRLPARFVSQGVFFFYLRCHRPTKPGANLIVAEALSSKTRSLVNKPQNQQTSQNQAYDTARKSENPLNLKVAPLKKAPH